MLSVAKNRLLSLGLTAALALGSTAVLADGSSGLAADVVFAGPATAVSSTSVTVQNVPIAIVTGTQIFGLDSNNLVVTLDGSQLLVGDYVSVYAHDDSSAATADLILRGVGFSIKGQVTALQTDSSGNAQAVIDGVYTINIGQVILSGGDEDGGSIAVGSEVRLWGIVNDGVFVAIGGQLDSGGGEAMDNGFVQNLTTDSSGTVTAFTMTSKGSIAAIALGSSTRIILKGQDTTASSLQAGLHVKVWGTTQSDGSVLASTILIKGGSRH